MKTVTSDIVIDLPVRTVYDQWTQFEEYPAFMTGVEEVRQLADDRLYWLVRVGGVERGFEAQIIEQKPDERIEWASTSGPNNQGVVTFEDLEGARTRVSLWLGWEPEGFVESIGAVMRFDQAQVNSDLKKFAELVESKGSATGAWRGTITPPPEGDIPPEPGTGGRHGVIEEPGISDMPGTPGTPDVPQTPGVPGTPDIPGTPGIPRNPQEPGPGGPRDDTRGAPYGNPLGN